MNRVVPAILATATFGGMPVLLAAPIAHATPGGHPSSGGISNGVERGQPAVTPQSARAIGVERGSILAGEPAAAEAPAAAAGPSHEIAAPGRTIVAEPWAGCRARAPPR